MNQEFRVIVTLGPSNMEEKIITQLSQAAPCLFRINGSHSSIDKIREIVSFVKKLSPAHQIMVDLPGNKIRTSDSYQKVDYKSGDNLVLYPEDVNYTEFHKFLQLGDVIYTNDSLNSLEVVSIDKNTNAIQFKALNDGNLTKNKGIHVRKPGMKLPFLFERDRNIIKLASEIDIDVLALSFVRQVEDVRAVKDLLIDESVQLIAKIETMEAVQNLSTILPEVENILVDRGDLSNDVGMAELPFYQHYIVKKGIANRKKVFLATQFLKYMETHSIPLIAEVMGLYNDISEGISGIQLSEETAIGKHPLECVEFVMKMYKQLQNEDKLIIGSKAISV